MPNGLVVYFCGLSGKWRLDKCSWIQQLVETGNRARIGRQWHVKMLVTYRTILGDNVKTFHSKDDAQTFAIKRLGRLGAEYEPIWDNGVTEWRKEGRSGQN